MQNHSRGFTLIELLLTLAIGAILLSLAVPSMSSLMSSARVSGAADRIKSEIELYRTEAVKNNQTTTVTFTSGNNWSIGDVSFANYQNTSLTVDMTGNQFDILATGLANIQGNGTVTISDGSHSATLTLTPLGRANICSDNIAKYSAC